ncbi:TetR/AcrR family transcriptional regulator [Gordonia sp. DT30]|uniref:TetR/AcrR family transcriptional regulator n=1 Tax=unclassified Gordonia (in: high G+C Gram-positive bacteria) TaxID=2657482 RepID=UPI003CE80248
MSTTPTNRRTPATEVRANLIRAGRHILERDGVSGLTVRAVAKEAGVAPMGVYNHFDGKEGLLDALVSDAFFELATATATTDTDPVERLAHSGRAYREFALAFPTVYELMFSADCDPSTDAAATAFDSLADVVRYGQVAGMIRAGDPLLLAMQIWSCVHGAVSLELARSGPPFIDPAGNYADVIALIARGVRP